MPWSYLHSWGRGPKKNCSADGLPRGITSAVSAQALSFCCVCRGQEFEKGAVVLLCDKTLPRQQTLSSDGVALERWARE